MNFPVCLHSVKKDSSCILDLCHDEVNIMKTEAISIIWIDDSNRLCIQPATTTFEMIYRSAMGVQWNGENHYLYSQAIHSWTPVDWFHQILAAVEVEYGYHLKNPSGKT